MRIWCGIGILVFIVLTASGARAGEVVQVENDSKATKCAETDNLYVRLVGVGIRHLSIEATPPVYLSNLSEDRKDADFSTCDMSHDPVFRFPPKDVVLFENRNYVLMGHTFALNWRRESADFRVGDTVTHDLHLVQLIRKTEGRRIEILVLYPADGYWRVKPLTPHGMAETAYGSSFLIGPIEQDGRPYVALSAVEFVPKTLTFRLSFRTGQGQLHVIHASPTGTRLEVRLPASHEKTAFAALRSMFVSPLVADAAEIKLYGDRPEPILDFSTAKTTAVTFERSMPSRHNSSAPDLRFGDFAR